MRGGWLALLLLPLPVWAAGDDPPLLPDAGEAAIAIPAARDGRFVIDAAWTEARLRDSAGSRGNPQLFLAVDFEKRLSDAWRFAFSDVLALQRHAVDAERQAVNTLIDAYFSWQPRPDRVLDVGRINMRLGVAAGFNPTDYFRANALRSVISIDPASLRRNRQGTVMLRGQALSRDGSLMAVYAPELSGQRSDQPLSLDLGATNARDRWLVAYSHKPAPAVDMQWLIHGVAGESPQFGINATTLLNDATVGFVEASAGRMPSLRALALDLPHDEPFRSQLAIGLTYTTRNDLSLTLEFDYNGTGLTRGAWDAVKSAPPPAYARYRRAAADLQLPPTTRRVFAQARWKDAIVHRLDVAGFAYYDLVDSSRQLWLEARYRWPGFDTALQWQQNHGHPASDFGSLPARWALRALATFYF